MAAWLTGLSRKQHALFCKSIVVVRRIAMCDGLEKMDVDRSLRPLDSGLVMGRKSQRRSKLLKSIDDAISATGLTHGATLSFHHHLRNGDGVLNLVMEAVAKRRLKNLHIAATSIFPVHAPLVRHIENGTVGRISANFIAGPVGEAISRGALSEPVILSTHGGRAFALDNGNLSVDVAFVAAPAADELGNISGSTGRNACGTLGYPQSDVAAARHVVAITDTIAPFPVERIDIAQDCVEWVVVVDSIGQAEGIASGAAIPALDPQSREISRLAAAVIAESGLLQNGFSFQTGAGSISLATASAVGEAMADRGVKGAFISGGITGLHVKLLQEELFGALMDVQCFDLDAVRSYRSDHRHQSMSAAIYAAPHLGNAVVDRLDAVVLGATEVDLDFNVNVTTKADGTIMGGSGGHSDTASGAKLTVITTKLTAAGYPKILSRVGTLTTPGETVDVIVTDEGIAVNPRRADLADRLLSAGLPLVSIETLAAKASALATRSVVRAETGRTVAVSHDRHGSVTDIVRQMGGTP
jgi:citrate lyase subunit alpha / citrate CoA-transferase